jgi:transposase
MEKRKRRRFTAEYKAEAVKRLEESGEALQQVADELGVHANQLRGWRNERLAAGSAEALARQRAEAAELVRLRREVKRLEQENEILKRAAAFFAREAVASRGTASSPPSAPPSRCGPCAGSPASR